MSESQTPSECAGVQTGLWSAFGVPRGRQRGGTAARHRREIRQSAYSTNRGSARSARTSTQGEQRPAQYKCLPAHEDSLKGTCLRLRTLCGSGIAQDRVYAVLPTSPPPSTALLYPPLPRFSHLSESHIDSIIVGGVSNVASRGVLSTEMKRAPRAHCPGWMSGNLRHFSLPLEKKNDSSRGECRERVACACAGAKRVARYSRMLSKMARGHQIGTDVWGKRKDWVRPCGSSRVALTLTIDKETRARYPEWDPECWILISDPLFLLVKWSLARLLMRILSKRKSYVVDSN